MRPIRSFFYGVTIAGAFAALHAFAGNAVAQQHNHPPGGNTVAQGHNHPPPGNTVTQDHHHPPGLEAQLHEKFYSTWYMPDEPAKSCCNKADCYPTEVKFQDGHWYARRREDGRYIPVPWKKVEQNRDNPDGRNHLCAPPPSATFYPPNTVFCFSLGGGI